MKKILAIVLAIITIVGCVFAFTGCKDKDDNTLVLATNAEFSPYEYKIGKKYYGIDMEIAKIIADELGMKLKISDMDFDSVVTSVQAGDADIALACLTVNAKRAKSVVFSTAYEEGAAQVLIVKKSDTAFDACTTSADVNAVFQAKSSKTSIGVQEGTTGEAYVNGDVEWGFSGIPNTNSSSYKNITQAISEIKNGNINYAVVDKAVAESLVASNSDVLKMINVDLTVEKYAIGVSKDKPELLKKINAIIERIKTDGTIDEIYAAYANVGDEGDTLPNSTKYVGVNG